MSVSATQPLARGIGSPGRAHHYRQDPAGDIARNAALVNSGAVPRHFRRLDATQLRSFVADRLAGCLFIPAPSPEVAAKLIATDVLRWLQSCGYDAHEELQV